MNAIKSAGIRKKLSYTHTHAHTHTSGNCDASYAKQKLAYLSGASLLRP